MLLFKKPFFAGLQSGAITLTFRRWQKPHVRPGGRYRCHPIGVHSYLWKLGERFELFHQAVAAFAVSSSGEGPVQNRMLGERLLGPVFTQGVGLEMHIDPCWSAAFVLSTGDPVWLRPELAVKYTW